MSFSQRPPAGDLALDIPPTARHPSTLPNPHQPTQNGARGGATSDHRQWSTEALPCKDYRRKNNLNNSPATQRRLNKLRTLPLSLDHRGDHGHLLSALNKHNKHTNKGFGLQDRSGTTSAYDDLYNINNHDRGALGSGSFASYGRPLRDLSASLELAFSQGKKLSRTPAHDQLLSPEARPCSLEPVHPRIKGQDLTGARANGYPQR
ncbi:hypothetical protein B0H65DRAFT_442774 [Neurospora tetraspora]|uniref:Uncharacterized protein n=1 Tax=Neurospora tetraspora TaxID=94610 RepID=A0AAE0JFH5_9PEZI|nr:hypothetical protein B0H65DRAFT_442774 [Neurospora tetraspora]